uniref:Uncharacterized protein n=1 Tax=Anguilla anguilla TaxID=7936 RepID=A0A0E9Q7T8_ANGAN
MFSNNSTGPGVQVATTDSAVFKALKDSRYRAWTCAMRVHRKCKNKG